MRSKFGWWWRRKVCDWFGHDWQKLREGIEGYDADPNMHIWGCMRCCCV